MVDARIDNADPNYGNSKATFQNETMPPSLFASVPPAPPWLHGNIAVSRGYFDDACDGIVEVQLKLTKGEPARRQRPHHCRPAGHGAGLAFPPAISPTISTR